MSAIFVGVDLMGKIFWTNGGGKKIMFVG